MRPLLSMLVVAVPLAAADIVSKETMETQTWAYHQRSAGWVVLCAVVLLGLLAVCRVPSPLVPPAAGLLAAGVLGNGLSALMHDLWVPNPLVAEGATRVVAFNLADVWAIAGIASLTTVVAVWLIRNRHRLHGGVAGRTDEHDGFAEDGNTAF